MICLLGCKKHMLALMLDFFWLGHRYADDFVLLGDSEANWSKISIFHAHLLRS